MIPKLYTVNEESMYVMNNTSYGLTNIWTKGKCLLSSSKCAGMMTPWIPQGVDPLSRGTIIIHICTLNQAYRPDSSEVKDIEVFVIGENLVFSLWSLQTLLMYDSIEQINVES